MHTVTAVSAARNATLAVFFLNGFAFAGWAGRLAATRGELGLSTGQLGLMLLVGSMGSMLGLPFAGPLADRIGTANVVRIGGGLVCAALLVMGPVVEGLGVAPLAGAVLFLLTLGMGLWDVSMNLEGAAVEHRMRRTVMPGFHAAFSVGTVAGSLLAAGVARLGVGITVHFWGVAAVTAAALLLSVRRFLPDRHPDPTEPSDLKAPGGRAQERSAWTEPRILLIGLVVLVSAFTEGTGYDWLTIAFVDGHHQPEWVGILGLTLFFGSMTLGRLLGGRLLDRFGRLPVLRVMLIVAAGGNLLLVLGTPALAFLGAALWGLGVSLAFPVGMSAAADDPARAGRRVSVVSTISYGAFLLGPPVLGFLGDHVGVLRAVGAVSVMTAVAFLGLPALRERRDAS